MAVFEDELADFGARKDRQGCRTQIGYLQHFAIVDPGLHKRRRNVYHQPQAGKTAAAFQPAGNVGRQGYIFHGRAQDRFPGPHGIAAFIKLDQRGQVVEVGIITHLVGFGPRDIDPQTAAQGQVIRRRPQIFFVKRRNRKIPPFMSTALSASQHRGIPPPSRNSAPFAQEDSSDPVLSGGKPLNPATAM